MPHEKFGKVGFLLCGGGCLGGLPQAVQLHEFNKACISPDWIGGVSVGALNAVNYKNPIETWQNNVRYPTAIYDLNPILKNVFKEARQFIAPFKKHESWKEWGRDFKFQKQNIAQALSFLKRTAITGWKIIRNSNNDFFNPKDFSSLSEFAISILKEHDLNNLSSILDISPLIKIVEENIDLGSALKNEPPLNVFVRYLNTGKEHVLTPKSIPELLLALRAACALVPFFKPVKIGEDYFCDIGAINPFPAKYAFDAGCDTVFAFAKDYEGQPPVSQNIMPQNIIELWFSELEMHTRKMSIFLRDEARERARKEE